MSIRPEVLSARKAAAKAYVATRRALTVCQSCGGGQIDWHRDDHPDRPRFRVSNMAMHGLSIEAIEAEINECAALCRRCHMIHDGRLVDFVTRARVRNAKVTEDDVRAIRLDARSQRQIAAEYGIAPSNVSHIKTGKTWAHVS